ncbi:hypothetical protein HanXRQr2_Chr05g0220771 [Helianthus annuus]|nr:hypothetical protein HanXRQr2_Chr05g0220771 [Helianthus annuus]KAJ0923224.1 hypothetical protein HanPSC8_Chr05g0213261 [Helianthus annuus]
MLIEVRRYSRCFQHFKQCISWETKRGGGHVSNMDGVGSNMDGVVGGGINLFQDFEMLILVKF